MESQIVFVSGHYPKTTFFAEKTRLSFEKYTKKHGYGFYYNEDTPDDTQAYIYIFNGV